MNYLLAFDISGSGMAVEKLRLDVTALNLANVHTSRTAEGQLFKPMRVVASPRTTMSFETALSALAPRAEIVETNVPPRQVYDPGHPDADDKGFVSYPNVNAVSEMVNLVATTRAYEANVRVLNAAKTMALRALEIGGGS